MKLLVSYLTRKRSGDVAHRDTEVDDDVIHIGRGTDCQIYLHDPRIAILQAEIHERAGGMYLQDAESRDNLVVNGDVTAHAILKPGDKIELGPFELVVVDLGVAMGDVAAALAREIADQELHVDLPNQAQGDKDAHRYSAPYQ